MKNLLPNYSNDSATRVFLACLPVLFLVETLQQAFLAATAIAAAVLGISLFFLLTLRLFPARLQSVTFFMTLAVVTQILFRVSGLHPVCAVSIFILVPGGLFSAGPKTPVLRQVLLRGLFFPVVFMILSVFHEFLGERLRLWSFYLPAGFFLLLAFAAFLWKNQPGRVSEKAAGGKA